MSIAARPNETLATRQAFPHWSIRIPATFDETFVYEGSYWHAWDLTRTVSLSSQLVSERGQPVSAKRIVRRMHPPEGGSPVPLPPEMLGWAVAIPAVQPARASRCVSGMLVVKGRVLIATITADDIAWATAVWRSIRYCRTPVAGAPVITLPIR